MRRRPLGTHNDTGSSAWARALRDDAGATTVHVGFGADAAAARRRLEVVVEHAARTDAMLARLLWQDGSSWPAPPLRDAGEVTCAPFDGDPNAREWSRARVCHQRLALGIAQVYA